MADLDYTLSVDTAQAKADVQQVSDMADAVISKLERIKELATECKGACQGCQVKADFTLRGTDLVSVAQQENYRSLRTS